MNKIFSHAEWLKLVDQTHDMVMKLSTLKGGEYAGDNDRLLNFRRNAEALGLANEQVWAVYAAKHWDAIMQYVKDIGTGKQRTRMESIEGRADDLIVYLMLFKAMVQERNSDNVQKPADSLELLNEQQKGGKLDARDCFPLPKFAGLPQPKIVHK